ncbi:MAG TPA: hypothetical protein VEI02_11185 [Planctomycetota bacterium]|nr:hypothetical protein [Planctomycetota bacterium]
MTGFRALLALDARLHFRRPLFATALVACALAAAGAAALGDGIPPWRRFASAARVAAPLLAAFGALLGAASLAADAQSGALRSVLTRPVSRLQVATSRALWLTLGQLATLVVALGAGALVARGFGSFGAVVHGDGAAAVEIVSVDEMSALARRLLLLATPALLAAPLLGFAAGAFFDDAAAAGALAIALVLAPDLASTFADAAPWWWYAGPAREAIAALGDAAEGVLTRYDAVTSPRFAARAAGLGAAWGAAAFAAASARLTRRDYFG